MTEKQKEYAFVVDSNNRPLAPTNINKAWILIRKQKAILISKYPMTIQLKREVKDDSENDESHFVCGIDDGSVHVGLSIVQKCKTKNKVVFKGQIEQRQDVKKLMEARKGCRKYRRSHKRYRQVRFNNRSSSKRKGRITPSIKQKRQAVLRVINQLNKWINIQEFWLEDVMIDIRAMTDGYKLYKWQYQKSNRLDENIRKAVILRDGCKCMECGKTNTKLEAHHIRARKYGGADIIANLITLCSSCHQKTKGKEKQFEERYFKMIKGKNVRLDYAQHVMQGKNYLRSELSSLGILNLTNGGDTANKRIDWNVNKTHSNDAIVITGLKPDTCDVKEWIIKPKRRQSSIEQKSPHEIKHGDLVSYNSKTYGEIIGVVSAIKKSNGAIKLTAKDGKTYGTYSYKKVKLLYRFSKIYFI